MSTEHPDYVDRPHGGGAGFVVHIWIIRLRQFTCQPWDSRLLKVRRNPDKCLMEQGRVGEFRHRLRGSNCPEALSLEHLNPMVRVSECQQFHHVEVSID